jgi:predicted nucleic-acid-binding protein
MTGLDTNVLVRFFVQDDAAQFERADSLMQSLSVANAGYISLIVLAEFAWVLRTNYDVSKAQFIDYIRQLLDSPQILIENESALKQGLSRFLISNADFADCVIERVCSLAGCSQTMTFDAKAAKSAGMILI